MSYNNINGRNYQNIVVRGKIMDGIPINKSNNEEEKVYKKEVNSKSYTRVEMLRKNRVECNISIPNEKPIVIPNPKPKKKPKKVKKVAIKNKRNNRNNK